MSVLAFENGLTSTVGDVNRPRFAFYHRMIDCGGVFDIEELTVVTGIDNPDECFDEEGAREDQVALVLLQVLWNADEEQVVDALGDSDATDRVER